MNSEPDKGAPMSKHIQVLIAVLAVLLLPSAIAGQLKEKHCSDYPYGLYYGSWTNKDSDQAFVISRGGKPIPQKANDPDAPTQPGFYVEDRRYEFASSKLSEQSFTFRTVQVDGNVFEFQGRFGCEQVDVIPEVPYLEGKLTQSLNGRVVRTAKLHFGHAVVL